MKATYFKAGIIALVMLAAINGAKAQTSDSTRHKRGYYAGGYNNTDEIRTTAQGKVEYIRTNWKDTYYEFKIVNNKMTELYVEGDKIPPADWEKYSSAIAAIRDQIRKDRIQAKKDQAQARLDQIQARKDQEQARRDQHQAELDQEQAHRDQIQAQRDQEQAVRDEKQAAKDQEQASEEARHDQIQAQKDQEQAHQDQIQAGKDQEQARLDQIQARKDQEEARKEQELMLQMIADLVSDKIVPNEKSLHDLTLSPDEMTVNGVKQPDEVFKRYKEKYRHFAMSNMSYGNRDGVHHYQGIHISHVSE